MKASIAGFLADALRDGKITPSDEVTLYHCLMTAYGGLTPKRIREEFTIREIVELLSLMKEYPGPVGEIAKIRALLEGLLMAGAGQVKKYGAAGSQEVTRITNDMTAEQMMSALDIQSGG